MLVCKQIHAEAELLPFELNVFDISYPWVFTHYFLGKLSTRKRNTIQNIRANASPVHSEIELLREYPKGTEPLVSLPNVKDFVWEYTVKLDDGSNANKTITAEDY